jgi:uncharacterized membrane protein YbhN (UPF0104 family)
MAIIFYRQDMRALRSAFGQVDPLHLVLSSLTFFLGQILLALRWWVLMRGLGLGVAPLWAIKLHLLGLFYNNVMPSSMGGDILRAYYVSRHTADPVAAAASVFIDRLVAGVTMLLVLVVVLVVWPLPTGPSWLETKALNGPLTVPLWVYLLAACLVAWLVVIVALRPGLTRSITCWLRGVVQRLTGCAMTYGHRPYIPLAAMGMTVVLQTMIIVAFWLLGRGMGIEAGLRYYLVIFPLTWLFSAIPISIAGVGLLEGGTVGLFVHLAVVPQEKALALALCQRFAWVVASLPGGIIHMIGKHRPNSISFDGRAGGG